MPTKTYTAQETRMEGLWRKLAMAEAEVQKVRDEIANAISNPIGIVPPRTGKGRK